MPTTATETETLIELESRYGAHNYHPLDVVAERGQGVYLWDVDGKRYMDFLAAYSAVNQGHNHPRKDRQRAHRASVQKLALTSRAFRNDQFPVLLRKTLHAHGVRQSAP